MFYLTGIIICFFLLAILVGKKNKSEADMLLVVWLFFIGLHLTYFYLFVSGQLLTQYPHLLGLEKSLPLLHGPFLFLYTSSLTNQVSHPRARYLHLLPVLLTYIPLLGFLFSSADDKVYIYTNHGIGYEWFTIPMGFAYMASGIVYVLLSLKKLHQHQKNITDHFSNTDRINLAWLRYLIFGLGLIWLTVIYGNDKLIFSVVVLYILFIGYFGIKQTGIFSHNPPPLENGLPDTEPLKEEDKSRTSPPSEPSLELQTEKGKYQKSGLNENELHHIHDRLTQLMQREKLYTNPDLTLGDTAQQLNVHPNYLSQAINSISKKNFYDYINSQRVEEFNRTVKEAKNQKFTILTLAFEAGFNSKTSFNRNFRKTTGLSPSQYLKQTGANIEQKN